MELSQESLEAHAQSVNNESIVFTDIPTVADDHTAPSYFQLPDELILISKYESTSSASSASINIFDEEAKYIQECTKAAHIEKLENISKISTAGGFFVLNYSESESMSKDQLCECGVRHLLGVLQKSALEVFRSQSMPNFQGYLFGRYKTSSSCFQSLFAYSLIFIDIVLRGIAQVFLCNHPITGLFIVFGLSSISISLAGYAILGCTSATIAAMCSKAPSSEEIKSGLCGYDGSLVGCACWALLDRSRDGSAEVLGVAIMFSALSGVVRASCSNILALIPLPAFTLSFNIVTISLLLAISGGNVEVVQLRQTSSTGPPVGYDEFSAAFMWEASVKGVGQFMFIDTIVGCCLVLLGISVSSRIAALAAWSGSVVACVTAVYLLQVPKASLPAVRNGLYGYNSAGTCAAIAGGVFFVPGAGASVLGLLGASVAVLQVATFQSMLGKLPVLTFPFIITAWVTIATRSKWLQPRPSCSDDVSSSLSSASSASTIPKSFGGLMAGVSRLQLCTPRKDASSDWADYTRTTTTATSRASYI